MLDYQMPYDIYRKMPAVSQSDCKVLLTASGRGYKHYKDHGIPESPAMLRGTLVHKMVLEGYSAFDEEYAVDCWPELTGKARTSKGYQEYKAELLASGKPYIKAEDAIAIKGMAQSLSDFNKETYRTGMPEVTIYGHQVLGFEIKGRIDMLLPNAIHDIKTTGRDLSDQTCARFLHNDLWIVQAAFYHLLVKAELGDSLPFIFDVIQDKEPYSIRRIVIDPKDMLLAEGQRLIVEAMNNLARFTAEGFKDFPDYKPSPLPDLMVDRTLPSGLVPPRL